MKSVNAKVLYTGKEILENADINFDKDRIASISQAPQGDFLGKYPVITPAFLDPHSHIGMVRAGEPSSEAEANEEMESMFLLNDALDSVHMDDPAFRDAVEMGVLYSCVLPGSGNMIGGLSAVIRNYAKNTTEGLVARAGIKAAFGYNPKSTREWKGTRPSTRMGAIGILRKRLQEVQMKMARYEAARGEKKAEITFTPEETVLCEILKGSQRLRCHVHKIDDISALLRLVDEFRLKITVEHAMDVNSPEIFEELKRRNISVTYGPLDAFAYKVELKHENWRNIRYLLDSGVQFGLMTDHPVILARQLFFQTRWFIRAGLSKQAGIELVSRKNAEILGLDKELGTIEPGKWASFVCWNGDPFEMTSYPVAVYGEGQLLFQDTAMGTGS